LNAKVPFRGDGNYELGDLFPNALSALNGLYGGAADAAQSWGDTALRDNIVACRAALSKANGAQKVEQWAVNKAVHYNEWTNFDCHDFEPVVIAFRELLECFRCSKCGSWLHVTLRTQPETLRCACNGTSYNLKRKPSRRHDLILYHRQLSDLANRWLISFIVQNGHEIRMILLRGSKRIGQFR
jgi:hypothetical protein